MMTTKLPIEFIGGPRDGSKSYLLRATPLTPLRYPIEIKVMQYDADTAVETQVGRYVRDAASADGTMIRYVWSSTIS